MDNNVKSQEFERSILPHLGAAYNLARWLTGSDRDAQDVVQESCLRAFKFIDGFRGGSGRAWLLSIVRNASYTWLEQHRGTRMMVPLNEEGVEYDPAETESLLHQQIDGQIIRQAVEKLPVDYREVIVLREIEGLSYKEIADLTDVPLGTVMSRLARARARLQHELSVLLERK